MHALKILVIDRHPLFRRSFRDSVAEQRDLLVAGEAAEGQEGIRLAERLVPDMVLLALDLPDSSGLEVASVLRGRHPQMGLLVLAPHEDDEQLFSAIRAGAHAFATKDIDPTALIQMVHRVGQGEYLINETVLQLPVVASRVLDQFRELSQVDELPGAIFSPLTPREREILNCLAEGHSNKEIARLLNISDQTVKNHITAILRKLAVNDRTQAVIYALRHGWIKLTDETNRHILERISRS